MKTIFITGAFGFLGSHLLEILDTRKYKIRCLTTRSNINTNKKLQIIHGNILNQESYSSHLKDVDVVIHLAASVISNKDTYNINVNGTKKLIEECKKYKINRFIHISSVAAHIDSVYGISKRDSELLVLNSGLDYTILRPPLIIGKNSHGFERLIHAVKTYPLVPVIGPGTSKINPVYVKDVAQAIVKCIENKKSIKKSYNVAGSDILTYNEFMYLVMRYLHKKKTLIHIPTSLCYLLAYLTPFVTIGGIKFLTTDTIMDIKQTTKDINYKPTSLSKALKEILS